MQDRFTISSRQFDVPWAGPFSPCNGSVKDTFDRVMLDNTRSALGTRVLNIRIRIQDRIVSKTGGCKLDGSFIGWVEFHIDSGIRCCALQIENGER